MTFKEQVEADVAAVFLNEDEFAESITYTPTGGVARTILAIVDRQDETIEYRDGGQVRVRVREIHVADHATTGIDYDSLALQTDTVTITDDSASELWPILEVVDRELGMFGVRVERVIRDEISADGHRRQGGQ